MTEPSAQVSDQRLLRLFSLAVSEGYTRHLQHSDMDGFGASCGHANQFHACPHADCLLVQSANWLSQADAPPRWQPIETVPKDGTRVLVYSEEFKQRILGIAYYWRGVPGDGEGWVAHAVYSEPDDRFRGALQNPTHWQPLPSAPVVLRSSEDEPTKT